MRHLHIFIQVVFLLAWPTLAQDVPPVRNGCVLKHVIPDNVWLVYATENDKDVRYLGNRKDMLRAAKDCRDYLKGKEKDASDKKSKVH